jgi:HSP20 family protein
MKSGGGRHNFLSENAVRRFRVKIKVGESIMAETGVKKAEQKTDVARGTETGMGRRSEWDPFGSWPSPSALFSSNPFSVMRRFSEEMDRAFGNFFEHSTGGDRWWSPAIEVAETEGQLKVHADLPGLKPEDVRVEVSGDHLTIRGERKSEREDTERGMYRSERRYGQFYRAIPLPEGALSEQIKAQFNNGVLEITVPVPERKSKRRQITIESAPKK